MEVFEYIIELVKELMPFLTLIGGGAITIVTTWLVEKKENKKWKIELIISHLDKQINDIKEAESKLIYINEESDNKIATERNIDTAWTYLDMESRKACDLMDKYDKYEMVKNIDTIIRHSLKQSKVTRENKKLEFLEKI